MLLAQGPNLTVVLVMAGIMVVFVGAFLLALLSLFRPWLQAFLAGAPISVLHVLGMRLRRTDVQAVVNSLIMSQQAGLSLSIAELERAYLQGVDLERLVLAAIHAHKQGMDVRLEDLVEADLEGRLAEKLGLSEQPRST